MPDTWEKSYSAAHRMIAALDDVSLDRVVMAHKERLIASLLRQGESLPLKPVKSAARVMGVRRRKS
ncbi:hypothetical protein FKW81_02575 [Rhodobacter capsulatus]|uniref:hypothetical protein n=2 Tax=Rhodobacter capsulatus TaxID=1061 RepID=UPI0011418FAD|nr:hypothetical protein [Rhodobacter capsulatus]TQD37484.1 hypothetical protein FKW81_02575 [Rhodobacter capsulatus]